jgi:hypothetical protein
MSIEITEIETICIMAAFATCNSEGVSDYPNYTTKEEAWKAEKELILKLYSLYPNIIMQYNYIDSVKTLINEKKIL